MLNYYSWRNIDRFEIPIISEGLRIYLWYAIRFILWQAGHNRKQKEVGTYSVADSFKFATFLENHFFETGMRKCVSPDFCYTGRESYLLQLRAFQKCLCRGGSRLGLQYTTLTDGRITIWECGADWTITSMRLPFLRINFFRPEPRNAWYPISFTLGGRVTPFNSLQEKNACEGEDN